MKDDELFYLVEDWANGKDFWKSDAEDWDMIFSVLVKKGFTFLEACEIVESTIHLTKSEYGE